MESAIHKECGKQLVACVCESTLAMRRRAIESARKKGDKALLERLEESLQLLLEENAYGGIKMANNINVALICSQPELGDVLYCESLGGKVVVATTMTLSIVRTALNDGAIATYFEMPAEGSTKGDIL